MVIAPTPFNKKLPLGWHAALWDVWTNTYIVTSPMGRRYLRQVDSLVPLTAQIRFTWWQDDEERIEAGVGGSDEYRRY